MMDVYDGLLSGKYDSTKQRAVLLNGDRIRNYRSYTATMRLELLLTGRLVFTDAQFFDGLYFHWLAAKPEELAAFEKRMVSFGMVKKNNIPMFSVSVKCRMPKGDEESKYQFPPDLGQVAVDTFCKEFQFSSMENDQLVEVVFDLGKDYSEKYQSGKKPEEKLVIRKKPKNANIDDYVDDMGGLLKSSYGTGSALVESWENFTYTLKELFSIKQADKWGFRHSDGQWGIQKWNHLNSGCLNQELPGTGQLYIEKMKSLLDEAEGSNGMNHFPAGTRYFARIRGELNGGIQNRSKITMMLSKLEYINNAANKNERNKKYANECFQDFRQLLNERYNKLLALQHGCKFLDLCDYTKIFDNINEIEEDIVIVLPTELIRWLAELSWESFNDIIEKHQNELETAFYKWMAAYDGFDLNNVSSVKEKLNEYLNTLTSIFVKFVINNAVSLNEGMWNVKKLYNESIRNIFAQSYPFPYYLVGGGSFSPGIGQSADEIEGNEICIMCVESGDQVNLKKMVILRLRLDYTADTVNGDCHLNTLLAPVCNPLNGGDLFLLRRDEL